MRKIYCADFETRNSEAAIEEKKTWVWAYGICDIEDFENVEIGTSIEQFFNKINSLGSCVVYFHNLKFDGGFILDYICKNHLEHTELIDGNGSFYYIRYKHDGIICEFRDSLKKVPGTLKEIGESFKTKYQKLDLDYLEEREPNSELTEDEKEYLKNDVRILGEVIKFLYDNDLKELTIGSSAMRSFINIMGGKKVFDKGFPWLDDKEDDFVRSAYRGGYCYCKDNIILENCKGETYDVNSLYPYVMHSKSENKYPYDRGVYYTGEYKKDDEYDLYVQHFSCMFWLKPKHLPTIQIKRSLYYNTNEYVKESNGVVELTLTSVDLKLFLEHYNVDCLTWIDGYKYKSICGVFDKYINYWAEIKANSKGAKRQLAKLMLNNLSGKFGTKKYGYSKTANIKADGLNFEDSDLEKRKGGYVPVAAFCTAYARAITIRAAQLNYKTFCYADTDSLHLTGKAKGLKVDPVELGAWKNERSWTKAHFVRQKTYIEYVNKENGEPVDPYYNLVCSGMDKNSKNYFIEGLNDGSRDWHEFKEGLLIEGLKRMPKYVDGGTILVSTKFEIKAGALSIY